MDDWEQMGAEGWNAQSTWPLLKRLETNENDGEHHGKEGPVHLMNIPPHDPCGVAVLDACEQVGIPRVEFNSGETVVNGASFFQINRRQDGTRSSSSVSYLHPILDRENFHLLTDTWVKEITFEGDRATGVKAVLKLVREDAADPRLPRSRALRRSHRLPKLLMLSGIGDREHLAEHGIEARVHSPASAPTSRITPKSSSAGMPRSP